jgi:hypothetical protein
MVVSSKVYPDLERKPGGPDNWVEKAGGLPSYIERIAKHLHYEKAMSISHAIATAVNTVKKMCASGDLNYPGKQSANSGSKAEACAAVAQWEKKKASGRVNATEVTGRKLSDFEFAELIGIHGLRVIELAAIKSAQATARPAAQRKVTSAPNRAPGASGSNQPFDESKYLRNPGNGKFSAKFTPAELIAGRRIVEGGLTNLQVGQVFELPGDSGWVKRSEGGYLIQGPAGIRVVVRNLSEAIQASANIIAGKLRRVGEPTK